MDAPNAIASDNEDFYWTLAEQCSHDIQRVLGSNLGGAESDLSSKVESMLEILESYDIFIDIRYCCAVNF